MDKRVAEYTGKITSVEDKGIGYDDALYSCNMDSNPERTEFTVEAIDCSNQLFVEALLSSKIGCNFVSYRSGKIADIGGCGLQLEIGAVITIFSDRSVTN